MLGMGLSLSLGVGQAPAINLVSGSVRARQAIALGANTGTNNFLSYQAPDKTNVRIRNPIIFVWNGYRSQSDALEKAAAQYLYYCYSMYPAPNGKSLDQTGRMQVFADWSAAANDTQIRRPNGQMGAAIIDLNGNAVTYADFATAGGSISTVSGNPVVQIPAGYGVFGQCSGIDMAAGAQFLHRVIASGPVSTSNAIQTNVQGDNTNDYSKTAASHAASLINTENWTGASGLNTTGASIPLPTMIYGEGNSGVKTIWVDGDSIATGEPGDGRGDTDNAAGYIKRALNLGSYSWVGTSVPSTRASWVNGRTLAIRDIMVGIASVMVTNYGHNERGLSWGTGALTPAPTAGNSYVSGDGNFWSIHRRYWLDSRSKMKSGAKVIAFTLLPQQAGGINSGGTAITAITSSGTTATATVASSASLTVGQVIQIGASDVAGYHGNVEVASKPDGTHFTFTIPNGGSDLAAATTAKYATVTSAWPTSTAYASYHPYLLRTGAFSGIPFESASGDPDSGLDAYTAAGSDRGLFPAFAQTQEGTHPLGNNTSATSGTLTGTMATALLAALQAAIG